MQYDIMENEETGETLFKEHTRLAVFGLVAGIVLLLIVVVWCSRERVAVIAVTWLAPLTIVGVINLLGHILIMANKTILVARAGLYLAIPAVIYFIALYLFILWITSWTMN